MGTPQHWRVRKQRYALVGDACNQCGTKHFPPRTACPVCSQAADDPFNFEGNGKDYSAPLTIKLPLPIEHLGPTLWPLPERTPEFAPYPQSLPSIREP